MAQRMLAAQVMSRDEIRIITTGKPELLPGHAVVRSMILSICGSDLHRLCCLADEDYPLAPGTSGHEMIGIVEAVDAPGSQIKIGDVVLALAPKDNAMAEYFLAAREDILPIPEGTDIESMLMAQQLGTVIHACKRLPNLTGAEAAVIGQGSAGLFFDFMLRRLGAQRVIALDLESARLVAANSFGATHGVHVPSTDAYEAVMEITDGQLVDLVVEAAGESDAINLTPKLVKTYGHLLFFGVPRLRTFPFDFYTFFRKYCSTASISGTAKEPGRVSVRSALNIIAAGKIDVRPMITHRFPFEQVREAYELAKTRRDGVIKVVIEMPWYRKQLDNDGGR
jgi:threonine dehydrogenase-like Zn-dependent dehydrogenase